MKEKITFWILFGILIVVTLLYPGDVPWINDGPKLIYNAYISNLHNTFPTSGLIGSLGIPYGPLPVWIYKFLLLISKNLILIVLLKASATLIIVFLSLYFIVKTLNLPIYVMLIPFISPYLYFYARSIWDNCFLIPVSAIFLLTLIKFINTHRLFWFVISFCAIFCLIHIHLMSLLIIIPFFIYLIIFEGKWLLEHWQKAAIVFSIFLCSLLPYLIIILTKSVHVLIVPEICTWHNWMSPMTFFSFWGFDNYFVPEMLTKDYIIPKGLYLFLKILSGISFIFFIIGFSRAVKILWTKAFKKTELTVEERFLLFCVITIIFSVLWFTISGVNAHPHYNNATCFVYYFLICFCLKHYWGKKVIYYSFWAYLMSMLLLLISFSFYIHISGGTRTDSYGSTLKNQINIVKQMNLFNQQSQINVYPNSLGQLREFGTCEFLPNEFKGSNTPMALINAIQIGSKIKIPIASTPIESLNNLLEDRGLYQVLKKRPEEAAILISRLEKRQTLNLLATKWLNRSLIEANYSKEAPKRQRFPNSLWVLQNFYGKPEELRRNNPLKVLNVLYKDNDKTGWIVLK